MCVSSLELIIGPMFAGKSTEIIKKIKMYNILEKKVLVINHSINNRYGHKGVSTHDENKIENSINVETLQQLENEYYDYFIECDVVIIDELQFFNDAFTKITEWLDKYDKKIIGAGLISDFEKKPFGDVLKLIPHAEDILKLNALCKKCKNGTKACFSKRITNTSNNNDQIMVGSNNSYEAVCRKHYKD